jgi:succinate dehydrogenase / fumarate reductase membrane anchor subunit
MTSYRTALGRARGLGSAKHGVSHWIVQRVSAVALAPLGLWALYSALRLSVLLAAAVFVHMKIGMEEVIQDYIHTPGMKAGLLLLNLFVAILGGVTAVFCILKIALIGGAV